MTEEAKSIGLPEIKPAISFANKAFREHFLFLLAAFYVSTTICQAVTLVFSEQLRSLITLVYSSFFVGGLINIFLTLCDGGNPPFSVLVSKRNLFWKFLCAHLLVFLACFIGIVLFIIPGIILMIRFSFYVPAIAERGYGPIEALKYSWQITGGKFWKLILFNLVTVAVLIIPAIIAGIFISAVSTTVASIMHMTATSISEFVTGLVVPILFVWWQLAAIHAYRQLSPRLNAMQA